jgi:hypothetical protein
LNVSVPATPRTIVATEYQVTGLDIEVRDPDDKVLKTIAWQAEDGSKSYLIPVEQQGKHEIRVTHIGEKNGTTVETTESATFDIKPMVITVIDIVPGSIGMINVKPEGTSAPINLTGFWNFSITTGGETMTGGLYFLQTGSSLNGTHGVTGTVDGSNVTWGVSEGPSGNPMAATGTMQGSNKASGTISAGSQSGTWEMTRAVLSFGSLNLDGMATLHTDKALGWKYVPRPEYRLDFTVPSAWPSFYGFAFSSDTTNFAAGQVRTVSESLDGRPNEIWVGVSGSHAQSGQVRFTRYDAGAAAAAFELNFEGGDYLKGTLDFSGSGGTFTIDSGSTWGGSPLSGSWSVASWSAYMQDNAREDVSYIDQDLRVALTVGRHTEQAVGTFSVPDQRFVSFSWEPESGAEIHEDALSGTVTIDQYQENVRIKGSFSLQFPSGPLSGSFDVPCTTEGNY